MIKEAYLTAQRAEEFTGGTWLQCESDLKFTGVSYAQFIKGNIYFPVNKNKRDLVSIQDYIDIGISAVVLENEDLIHDISIPILLVESISKALSAVARGVRKNANPKTVLITGTEGKTGTKLQLHQLLKSQTKLHAVLNSQNNLNSVYRTLADIGIDDKVELTEVGCGANTNLNRTRGRVVNPDICFYTQIGLAHMDFHKTFDTLLTNKASVIAGLKEDGICIVNSTIECFDGFIHKLKKERQDVSILTYGYGKTDTAQVLEQTFDTKTRSWSITANIGGELVKYTHPVFHQFIPTMSVGILLVVKELGYDIQIAALEFMKFKPFETMGQLLDIRLNTGSFLFYNQSRRGGGINSIVSSFKDLENFTIKGKVIALFGSMSIKEDEQNTYELHKDTADLINTSKIDRLYTTGIHMDIVQKNLTNPSIFIKHSDDYNELLYDLMNDLDEGDLLFIKGHATLNLTRIAKMILNHKDTSHTYKIIKGLITL